MLKILKSTLEQVNAKKDGEYYTVQKENRTYKCIKRTKLSKYSPLMETVVATAGTQKELAHKLDWYYL